MNRRTTPLAAGLLTILGLVEAPARGQGIAFLPTPAPLVDGVTMGTTPVVSADRRYVRLGVNAGFQAVTGLETLNIPLGAVSGGPGGFAGMNGPIGGGLGTGPGAMMVPPASTPPVLTADQLGFNDPPSPRKVPRSKRLRERARARAQEAAKGPAS